MITVVTVWFLIAVGVGYAGLLARAPVPPPAIAFAMSAACLVMWRAHLLWNAVGLADILIVLSRGIRMLEQDPAIGEQFTSLPLALLPTFLVPLIIASHVVLFVSRDTRLRR